MFLIDIMLLDKKKTKAFICVNNTTWKILMLNVLSVFPFSPTSAHSKCGAAHGLIPLSYWRMNANTEIYVGR